MRIHKFKYFEETDGDTPTEGEGATPVEATPPAGSTEVDNPTEVNEADKGIEATPGEGEKTPDEGKAPESYDEFKMPEGVEVDTELADAFAPLMKEAQLTQEQAQLFATTMAKQVQMQVQIQQDAAEQQNVDWLATAKADKDYGGDKFDENVGIAAKAVEHFGNEGFREVLENYGLYNHPEMIRFMVNVGKATQEDKPGGNTGGSSQVVKDHVSILYPNN